MQAFNKNISFESFLRFAMFKISKYLSLYHNQIYIKNYSGWDFQNYEFMELKGLPNESGYYTGFIISYLKEYIKPGIKILLAGESNKVKPFLAAYFKVTQQSFKTASLASDTDYLWNFDKDPPKSMGKYDIIVSHSILEHLIDPYKHFKNLTKLLKPGGLLMINTASQFFPYHRYPIDTMRFFPDWFETIAKINNLEIISKSLHYHKIYYIFKRQGAIL